MSHSFTEISKILLGFSGVIALFALLIHLGFWQLDRAEIKTRLSEQRLDQQKVSPERLPLIDLAEAGDIQKGQRVRVEGTFTEKNHWLLDNQINDGKFGYRVVSPLCSHSTCILVDRGWVGGSVNRRHLPEIESPDGKIQISGTVDSISENPFLGRNEPMDKWPRRIQGIELSEMEKESGLHLAGFWIHLDAFSAGAFEPHWNPLPIKAEKHLGYAFQWFSMALVLLILTVYFVWKNRTHALRGDPARGSGVSLCKNQR